jgi:hypothetical protein
VRPLPPGGSSWGGLEIAAVVLLALGNFVAPAVGPAVGLVLMCCSPRWSAGEKVVATVLALVPAVLLGLTFAASFLGLAIGLGVVALFFFAGLSSVAAAIYLAVVLSRRS